jgi:hypothetical protein
VQVPPDLRSIGPAVSWGPRATALAPNLGIHRATSTAARLKQMKKLLLLGSHLFALAAGFGLGVYVLPILTAPEPPSATEPPWPVT